jgi:hypothetical protein
VYYGVLSVVLVAYGARTVYYARIWLSEIPVFENAFRTCPRSAKVWTGPQGS